MRLGQQAVHCNFEEALERNILSKFVAGSNMPAFQERCCKTNDLPTTNLANALTSAQGYESSAQNMKLPKKRRSETNASVAEADARAKTLAKLRTSSVGFAAKWVILHPSAEVLSRRI